MRIRPGRLEASGETNVVAKQRTILIYPARFGHDVNCRPVQVINRSKRYGKYLFMSSDDMLEETNSYFGLAYGLVQNGKLNPYESEIVFNDALSNFRYLSQKNVRSVNSIETIVLGDELAYANSNRIVTMPKPMYYTDEEQAAANEDGIHYFLAIRRDLREAIVKTSSLVDSSTRFLFITNTNDSDGLLDNSYASYIGTFIGIIHLAMTRCFFRSMKIVLDTDKGFNIPQIIPDHEGVRTNPDMDALTALYATVEAEFNNLVEMTFEDNFERVKLFLHFDEAGCQYSFTFDGKKEAIQASKRLVVDKSYRLSI